MTVTVFLYNLFIYPIQIFFEIIYSVAFRVTGNPGLSIIVLSFIVNILVLPLYMRADSMQKEQREKEELLSKGVKHIKTVFNGDERMMMLQTYYRQMEYKQTDTLNSSVSLLLQIPFFIAAYQFLSNLALLSGTSFGPIADLSKPDALISIGGFTLNLLPVLMTVINLLSSTLFSKGYPMKTRVQLYAMAAFFLVFLYQSPSGLVFYWTLNNAFSLVKTIFYKLKNPLKVLTAISSAAGVFLMVYGIFIYSASETRRRILLVGLGILCLMPALFMIVKSKFGAWIPETKESDRPLKGIMAESVFLFLLLGCLIPSAVIASSPQEFMDLKIDFHPFTYILASGVTAFGLFVIWMHVFYWIADKGGKRIYEYVMLMLCGVFAADYLFFSEDLGTMTPNLHFGREADYSVKTVLFNLFILLLICLVLYFLWKKSAVAAKYLIYAGGLGLAVMTLINLNTINKGCSIPKDQLSAYKESRNPYFTLSKTGKNVVVIMLDRSLNEYIPYMVNEKPELKEKLDGFTYYENIASFGQSTNFGVPPFYGGYEYTPVEMNRRDQESLASKQNEVLKVMPVLFDQNGFEVTVFDPVYAGYQWIPDLTIYDDYPGIKSFSTAGIFTDEEQRRYEIETNKRNFFCYSLMRTVPLCLQKTIYNTGIYNNTSDKAYEFAQQIFNPSQAQGVDPGFTEEYNELCMLPDMTKISETAEDHFFIMSNDTTHNPVLLQEPDYVPEMNVDNSEYDSNNQGRFTIDGKTIDVSNTGHYALYETNMAAILKLSEWFDFLRENGMYDNTRIIIGADHGWMSWMRTDMFFSHGGETIDLEMFYPLLLVKDFDSHGFTVSEEFMTNADVPTLAMKGIIEHPVNPFTGKKIDSSEKTAHDQYVIMSGDWSTDVNNGNTFLPGTWLSVHDDVRNTDNWSYIADNAVLKDFTTGK